MSMFSPRLIVFFCIYMLLSSNLLVTSESSYVGAVVEHNTWMGDDDGNSSSSTPQALLNYNLNLYTSHVKLAKSKGAQVVVFPEFGLTATRNSEDRTALYPFIVRIPEVASPLMVPCDNPTSFDNSSSSVYILYTMSCAAKKSAVLVLINTIDWVDCDPASDKACPDDLHYQYNTDILFDENGAIVAKYHKSHEWPSFKKGGVYDQVPTPSQVTYTSSFGVTFGLFICFDIMFEDPPKILRQQGVEHFLYAVAQGDAGLNTLIKDWSSKQKAIVLASNLGAGSKRGGKDGSDCSGIVVNGTIVEADKYMLGVAAFPDENILIATIAT